MNLQYVCIRLRLLINVEIEVVPHALFKKELFFKLVKKTAFSGEIWFHLNK